MSEGVRVVVVTGLSGAGKSTALNSLEDLGYFCVDNLPTALLERTVEVCEAGGIRRIALGVDVRVGSFLEGAAPALERIAASNRDLVVLFLDASDEAIIRRYSESRRPHPLAAGAREGMLAQLVGLDGHDASVTMGGDPPYPPPQALLSPSRGAVAVLDGIALERERLAPLRAKASVVIDSTRLSVHDLRRQVIAHLGPGKAEQHRMVTRFVSFGFKYGLPVDADVVLDVRLLDNPFFVPELRHLPGTSPEVRDYVLKSPEAVEFIEKSSQLLSFSLPRYEREGKSYLTVAIGCTGGRHRSVTVAAVLAERLRAETGLPILVFHRDVARADIFGISPPAQGRSRGGRQVSDSTHPGGRPGATSDVAIGRFTIVNVKGLHARAAMKLVQVASRYQGEVSVSGPDGQAANAKSVMGVLLLCGSQGTTIEVQARGDNPSSVIDAIGRLIADRFGEPE